MNKKLLSILMVATLLLSSCQLIFGGSESEFETDEFLEPNEKNLDYSEFEEENQEPSEKSRDMNDETEKKSEVDKKFIFGFFGRPRGGGGYGGGGGGGGGAPASGDVSVSIPAPVAIVCPNAQADILVLIDESGSITAPNFKKQKQFILDMVNQLSIGPTNVRIALVSFSWDPPIRRLEWTSDKNTIMSVTSQLPYRMGATCTGEALDMAAQVFQGARPGLPKLLILLTDGQYSPQYKNPIPSANALKNSGVTIFGVGIGGDIRDGDMTAISSPGKYFKIQTFAELPGFLSQMMQQTCNAVAPPAPAPPAPAPPAPAPPIVLPPIPAPSQTYSLDVLFIIDASGPTGSTYYGYFVQVARQLINFFGSLPGYSVRVGIIVYGDSQKVVARFGPSATADSALIAASPVGGQRNLGEAIRYATDYFNNNALPGATRIAVLFTAGSNGGVATPVPEADRLKNSPATVIVISIGPVPSVSEFRPLASPNLHFHFPTFDLPTIINYINTNWKLPLPNWPPSGGIPIINFPSLPNWPNWPNWPSSPVGPAGGVAPPPTTVCTNAKADIVVIFDKSGSVTKPNFLKMQKFVVDMVTKLTIADDAIRVSSVSYAYTAIVDFDWNGNRDDIIAKINAIVYTEGGTATGDALFTAKSRLLNNARTGVAKMIILLTDGENNVGSHQPIPEATEIKNGGTSIIAIGIGANIKQDELKAVASPNKFFVAKTFDELTSLFDTLMQQTCTVSGGSAVGAPVQDVDVIVVIDGSDGTGDKHFRYLIGTVRNVLRYVFLLHPSQKIRVGITVFGRSSNTVVSISKSAPDTFVKYLNAARAPGGVRDTSGALQFANDYLTRKARPNAKKVIVLLTTGTPDDQPSAKTTATNVKNNDVTIVAIGIGEENIIPSLQDVSSPWLWYRLPNTKWVPLLSKLFPYFHHYVGVCHNQVPVVSPLD